MLLVCLQVHTVDITNRSAVENAVSKILKRSSFESFIPYEFTQKVTD